VQLNIISCRQILRPDQQKDEYDPNWIFLLLGSLAATFISLSRSCLVHVLTSFIAYRIFTSHLVKSVSSTRKQTCLIAKAWLCVVTGLLMKAVSTCCRLYLEFLQILKVRPAVRRHPPIFVQRQAVACEPAFASTVCYHLKTCSPSSPSVLRSGALLGCVGSSSTSSYSIHTERSKSGCTFSF